MNLKELEPHREEGLTLLAQKRKKGRFVLSSFLLLT